MKMNYGLSCLAIFLAITAASARAEETAIVLQDNVNVRGQASLTGEVITRLKKGEAVTVLETVPPAKKAKPGEPSEWLRISMPTNTPVWINAEFLDANAEAVSARRLNIRSGPGENFSVVGRLQKGDGVHVIRKVNGWAEIEAPTNSYAFVAGNLVSRSGAAPTEPSKTAPAAEPANLAAAEPKTATPPAAEPAAAAPAPATTIVDTAANTAAAAPSPAPAISEPVKETATAVTAATTVANAAEPVKAAEDTAKAAAVNPVPVAAEPAPAPAAAKPPEVAAVPPEIAPPPKRVVSREGVVRRSVSIQAPSSYRLESPVTGKNLDYLHYPEGEKKLKPLLGHTVVVSGEEVVDRRWPSTPIIEIESIELR